MSFDEFEEEVIPPSPQAAEAIELAWMAMKQTLGAAQTVWCGPDWKGAWIIVAERHEDLPDDAYFVSAHRYKKAMLSVPYIDSFN